MFRRTCDELNCQSAEHQAKIDMNRPSYCCFLIDNTILMSHCSC
uniref:Uncharacterized protein n=1 Tax=Siphoviridae sp. ctfeV1 TaxID=2826417 RepID=A0A8S5MRQ3_9CAUD|nr:MAG TPA: hypothetical protein [Siphoviridae sp. ctfeV1]